MAIRFKFRKISRKAGLNKKASVLYMGKGIILLNLSYNGAPNPSTESCEGYMIHEVIRYNTHYGCCSL
jgi:hypothetical protein